MEAMGLAELRKGLGELFQLSDLIEEFQMEGARHVGSSPLPQRVESGRL